ncbi:hypothetical protein FRB96_000883 [Tulasnella sp. 330]|nr:hypothetical protein FRB96_000883 [Tulasnella sp. 330]KAG8882707.1 hypothetical protein FRB97_007847 [Tulasnella sp. 331]KAG8888229.1 hypothetical protein FRB98_008169 [Tulasnella sp. 332]
MASRLATIFGTEQDRVNCSFYYKTILLPNVYHNPAHDPQNKLNDKELQENFDQVYEDLYCELAKHGHLLELHVCDNVGDHLIGNVYARYEWETEAQNATDKLNDRWYAGRPLYAELSPVTDFREACCRQNENGECNRGGFCNFMHLRNASKPMVSQLKAGQRLERRLNPAAPAESGGWEPPVPRNGAEPSWAAKEEGRRSASPPAHRSAYD